MRVRTKDGLECDVVQEVTINGKSYFMVDPITPKYVSGILARYMICPKNQFEYDKSNLMFVEVVSDDAVQAEDKKEQEENEKNEENTGTE